MRPDTAPAPASEATLFVCGDVMTGRGIDQILPHPGSARIFEEYAHSARHYVEAAERVSGSIARHVDFSYIWGDALDELERMRPDARIVNLETAITSSAKPWPGKGVHYRMHPRNIGCLLAARIDCCVLANNHVLDWGHSGLRQTLDSLHAARIKTAGAGSDVLDSRAPALIDLPGGRVLVFAFAHADSGVPEGWAASTEHSGIELLSDYSEQTVARIAQRVNSVKQPGDIVLASIHWGSNWGYAVPQVHRHFARRLIDTAGVDLVHGHSSHHVKGIEVYRDHLILYGCGDLINDYEGIGDPGPWRSSLALLYFLRIEHTTGRLLHLGMAPVQRWRLRLQRAAEADANWLLEVLNREGREQGTRFERSSEGQIAWVSQ